MRIALVAEDYYPQLGGVPEHVHNLALQLNAWGHTAHVITAHMGDYPDAPFVRRVGQSRVIYANGGVSRVTTGWRLVRRLEALFRDGRYDVVHVHGGLAPTLGLAAPFAAWRAGLPVVATFHSWFRRSAGYRLFRRPLQRMLDRHAATNAVLTVAGDGPWRRYYERRARPLGASVRFVGRVFEDRPAYYRGADLYLCPTAIASFGVTLLEAMACATPLVVADNVGFRAVIAGGPEAVVVPSDDPAAWAEATLALLADPGRRAAMGRAGLAKAARFAWPRVAAAELRVYERVLGRPASAAATPASRPRYVREPEKTSVIASTKR